MLMMGFLHQDYLDVGDVQANVDEFMSEYPDLAAQVPAEVQEAVQDLTESELQDLLDRLGCEVLPPPGVSYSTWLTQIADHVRTATGLDGPASVR